MLKSAITSVSMSGTKSWADVVEEEEKRVPARKASIWDDFDISKVSNVGFKLQYVALMSYDTSNIVEIEMEDISSEINYWKDSVLCYVLSAHQSCANIAENMGIVRKFAGRNRNQKVQLSRHNT
ncbi:hypothetical protein KY289_024378 [Solanum tuberosum]|nr:hypothetical protein KY289_024378 [Solanum tuberosum]